MKETRHAVRNVTRLALLLLGIAASAGAAVVPERPSARLMPGGETGMRHQDTGWPPIIAALEGEWEGSGTLFGSAASFTMSWQPALGGNFVRLVFSNALVTDNGTTPVLAAEAFYRVAGDEELTGYWFDTRGELVTLRARVADDRIVTEWEASSERGRTTYRAVDADTVEVIDEVQAADGLQEFGRATYTRRARIDP